MFKSLLVAGFIVVAGLNGASAEAGGDGNGPTVDGQRAGSGPDASGAAPGQPVPFLVPNGQGLRMGVVRARMPTGRETGEVLVRRVRALIGSLQFDGLAPVLATMGARTSVALDPVDFAVTPQSSVRVVVDSKTQTFVEREGVEQQGGVYAPVSAPGMIDTGNDIVFTLVNGGFGRHVAFVAGSRALVEISHGDYRGMPPMAINVPKFHDEQTAGEIDDRDGANVVFLVNLDSLDPTGRSVLIYAVRRRG